MKYTLVDEATNKPYSLVPEAEEPQGESTLGYLGRTAARTATRTGEALAGLPGDIAHSIHDITNYLAPSVFPSTQQVREYAKEHPIISALALPLVGPALLPGSQDIRSAHENVTGEYLKPQSPTEEFFDTAIQDFTTLFAPELGLAKGSVTGSKALSAAKGATIKAGVGNVAAKTAETFGASPEEAGITKFVAMSLPFGASRKIKQSYNNSYDLSRQAAEAKPTIVPLEDFQTGLDKVKRTMAGHADQGIVNGIVKDLRESLGNSADLSELTNSKQNLNSHYNVHMLDKAKKSIGQIGSLLENKIQTYGKDVPNFLQNYNNAQSLYGEYANATKLLGKIKRYAGKGSTFSKIAGGVLSSAGAGLGYATGKAPLIAAVGAGAYGTYETAKFLNLLKNSPQARTIYSDLFKNAAIGNITALQRDTHKLNKMIDDQKINYTLIPED